MHLLSRRRGRKLGALAAAVAILAAVIVVLVVVIRQPVPVTARTLRIPVVDGPGNDLPQSLDVTFFTPPGRGRVPAILLAHGFGQTKDSVRPEAEQLARAGFAVLTWSARDPGPVAPRRSPRSTTSTRPATPRCRSSWPRRCG